MRCVSQQDNNIHTYKIWCIHKSRNQSYILNQKVGREYIMKRENTSYQKPLCSFAIIKSTIIVQQTETCIYVKLHQENLERICDGIAGKITKKKIFFRSKVGGVGIN